jgi:3-oxoacyl-[acyl-carrier-protein] synthase II
MIDKDAVVVTGLGMCTPLGSDPAAAIRAGRSAVMEQDALSALAHRTAAVVGGIDLRPWLKRRKDIKLMARPSQLALAAAGRAMGAWVDDSDEVAIFAGVGREPGDDGESEAALVAAQINGKLDEAAVAGPCRDLYPPLLPLKTLPNMALAHISIHLGVRGENGTWCGGAAAGISALRTGFWTIKEGRAVAALVVASDSWVSAGAVRDLLRMSGGKGITPPGEAGVALLLEPYGLAKARGARIYAEIATLRHVTSVAIPPHHAHLGDCRAADALLAVALQICDGPGKTEIAACEPGQPMIGVSVSVDAAFTCYDGADMDVPHA